MHILHIKCASYIVDYMKVYFTSSTAELLRYRAYYYAIRDYLVAHGHVITRDWLPRVEQQVIHGDKDLDIKKIYAGCVEAIKKADVVIVEDTVSNFSTGHQITLALRYRKPTLVLWQGPKHQKFNQMLIHGIESDILQVSEYTLNNLHDTLHTFIAKFACADEKSRFNLILNGIERNYLDWAQFVTGESRTKVIRQALRDTIDHDEAYASYLLQQKDL